MFSRTVAIAALSLPLLLSAARAEIKDGIPWQKDLKSALTAGKKADKPVMVRFYADWCPPCRQMARDTWPEKKITVMGRNFIPVLLDFDKSREARRRYEVNVVPYLVVISPTGRVLGRARGNKSAFDLWHTLDQALGDRELEKSGYERGSRRRR